MGMLAGFVTYVGYVKLGVSLGLSGITLLTMTNSSFRSWVHDTGKTISVKTGLDVHLYSIVSCLFLYVFNEPFLNLQIDFKLKFLSLFICNLLLLSILQFVYSYYSYLQEIYDQRVTQNKEVDWNDLITKYKESLMGVSADGTKSIRSTTDILLIYIYTSLLISFTILVLKVSMETYTITHYLFFCDS